MSDRLRVCFGVVALLATASLSLTPARAEDTIKLGVLEPFTGPWAKNGNESYVAMEIARDMINEQGGIKGKKISYVRGDAPDPSAGKSEAERIISQEGIKLMTGTYASPLGIAISAEAERHGIVHWETIASADIITKRGYKHVFQVGPAASRYGTAALDFIRDDLAQRLDKKFGDLRIALLWENRAFGTAVGTGARAEAKKLGVQLSYDEGYDQFTTDMTPLVQKLKDAKPDVLIIISFLNDTILFHRKAKELNFYVPSIVGVSAGHSVPDLKDSIGTTVNGLFVSDLPVLVNPAALKPEAQSRRGRVQQTLRKRPAPGAGGACGRFIRGAVGIVQQCAAGREIDGSGGRPRGRARRRSPRWEPDQWQRIEVLQLRSTRRPEGRGPEHPLLHRRLAMAGRRRAPSLSEETCHQ